MDTHPEHGGHSGDGVEQMITSAATEPVPAHQQRIIDALYRVNSFMAQITDLKQLLKLILIESKQVIGAEASSLMLYDEDNEDLYFEVALGEKGDQVKKIRLKMGEGIAGACAAERRTIVVNDTSRDDRHYKKADKVSDFVTRNVLATPMVRKDRLIGVLEVLNKFEDQPFTKSDVKVLEFFADHAAIAIENALLVEANMKAERLAALGQAVASISHYVKNIIAGIRGSASLIDHGLEHDNYQLVRDAWPILQRSNNKISSLVQDMLTYSKDREPELQKAHLNELADEIYQMMATSAAEMGCIFDIDLDGDMPWSMFDRDRLHDAVLNIVSNALQASQDQTMARVLISTRFDRERNRTYIAIEDNGPGIPEDIRGKIFEPFFSTKGSKGTGLGLAVTQKVVREHGGDIDLKSALGEGACFNIWLPLREPVEAEQTATVT
jgi:signal transduction histidine kinase